MVPMLIDLAVGCKHVATNSLVTNYDGLFRYRKQRLGTPEYPVTTMTMRTSASVRTDKRQGQMANKRTGCCQHDQNET